MQPLGPTAEVITSPPMSRLSVVVITNVFFSGVHRVRVTAAEPMNMPVGTLAG
jgi:hypothetical protein